MCGAALLGPSALIEYPGFARPSGNIGLSVAGHGERLPYPSAVAEASLAKLSRRRKLNLPRRRSFLDKLGRRASG
jgi:hypothetical protein